MRFYVASGLENRERAQDIIQFLAKHGHMPTYDWTTHGDVRGEGVDRLMAVASNEVSAVRDAELVIVMLPGGQGTHTELGIALATRANKRVLLWSATGEEFEDGQKTCVFYHHLAVERLACPYEELVERLQKTL